MQKILFIIGGPTAVGKSSLSMELAKNLNCSIISADSRQVYREMSIGTAKPTKDELLSVKHYCIDVASIHDVYSAGKFEQDADLAVYQSFQEGDYSIMCGGTGLYINAFLNGLDEFPIIKPEAKTAVNSLMKSGGINALQDALSKLDPEYYATVDKANSRRLSRALEVYYSSDLPYSHWLDQRIKKSHAYRILPLWINTDRQKLYEKINTRTIKMIENGWIEEVESLLPYRDYRPLETVGYKEIFQHLDGNLSKPQMIEAIQQSTRRYAKRQVTWFSNQYAGECIEYTETSMSLKDEIIEQIISKK